MSVIPSWCRVGAKCVYVGDSKWEPFWLKSFPVPARGEIVTINWIGKTQFLWFRDACAALDGYNSDGIAFTVTSLRPLISKSDEDDIAMFLSLLRPADALDLAESMLETSWENGR